MTNEHNDRGDGRDTKGRWTKGMTGNPNGRPLNVFDYDMADMYNFSQFPMEITVAGKKQLMTRQEVVVMKLFETAMKGRITAQKYLIEKFEAAILSKETVELWLEQWAERMDEDPESVPLEVVHMMRRALAIYDRPRTNLRSRTKITPLRGEVPPRK